LTLISLIANACMSELQVAVVGTGSSAVQAIPTLQKTARELVVFQVCVGGQKH
jgi:cation diffusion facilitator CzcD-associated flavoprotein CzcO